MTAYIGKKEGSKTKVQRYGWEMEDAPGRMEMIDKHQLHVHPAYQRSAVSSKLLAMASSWSWIACGVIIVGNRGGEYWVKRMREIGNEKKETEKGRKHLEKLIKSGARKQRAISEGREKREYLPRDKWPKCSQEAINSVQGKASAQRALNKLDAVKKEWENGIDIRHLSVSSQVAKRWREEGILPKRVKKLSREQWEKMYNARMDKKQKTHTLTHTPG